MSKIEQVAKGAKFGKWLVVGELLGSGPACKKQVKCKCDCGTERVVRVSCLAYQESTSCGCTNRGFVKHDLSYQPIYAVWRGIKTRCYSKWCKEYRLYGARGIKVCDEWRSDVQRFHEWAVANGWRQGLQVDRIDNDGDYEPKNCQITTLKENSRNQRRSIIWIVGDMEFPSIKSAAIKLGVSEFAIRNWCVGYGLDLPVDGFGYRFKYPHHNLDESGNVKKLKPRKKNPKLSNKYMPKKYSPEAALKSLTGEQA